MAFPAFKSERFTTEKGFSVATQVPDTHAQKVLEAIHHVHPYEEPVIKVTASLRTLHIRGLDEENPNKFWNQGEEDWTPEEHRKQA